MTKPNADNPGSQPVGLPLNDQLGQASEARWYCLDRDGVAMLCKDEEDARAQAVENDDCWPARAPHRAVLLGDVTALTADVFEALDLSPGQFLTDGGLVNRGKLRAALWYPHDYLPEGHWMRAADEGRLRAENATLKRDLQHARDGLTKGRTRMREDIARLQAEVEQLRAENAALKREAHTWWTAARDAARAERARCALRVELHSQYPIETDYDRGYDKARKDAAETLRTMGDDAGLALGPNDRIQPPAVAGRLE